MFEDRASIVLFFMLVWKSANKIMLFGKGVIYKFFILNFLCKYKEEIVMPFIKIEATNVDKEQKEKLVEELTRVAAQILGTKEEAFFVLIKENCTDNWGVGGKVLTDVIEKR